jgi:hypothetical protein
MQIPISLHLHLFVLIHLYIEYSIIDLLELLLPLLSTKWANVFASTSFPNIVAWPAAYVKVLMWKVQSAISVIGWNVHPCFGRYMGIPMHAFVYTYMNYMYVATFYILHRYLFCCKYKHFKHVQIHMHAFTLCIHIPQTPSVQTGWDFRTAVPRQRVRWCVRIHRYVRRNR